MRYVIFTQGHVHDLYSLLTTKHDIILYGMSRSIENSNICRLSNLILNEGGLQRYFVSYSWELTQEILTAFFPDYAKDHIFCINFQQIHEHSIAAGFQGSSQSSSRTSKRSCCYRVIEHFTCRTLQKRSVEKEIFHGKASWISRVVALSIFFNS